MPRPKLIVPVEEKTEIHKYLKNTNENKDGMYSPCAPAFRNWCLLWALEMQRESMVASWGLLCVVVQVVPCRELMAEVGRKTEIQPMLLLASHAPRTLSTQIKEDFFCSAQMHQ